MDIGWGEVTVEVGPARIRLRPVEPVLWEGLEEEEWELGRLCLALLPLAAQRWHGVVWYGGEPAVMDKRALAALPAVVGAKLLPHLRAPWLGPEDVEVLEGLEAHLRSSMDFPELSCASCRDQEARGEGPPYCTACPLVKPPARAALGLGLYRLAGELPAGAAGLVGRFLESISPRRARMLAGQLSLIHHWVKNARQGPVGRE